MAVKIRQLHQEVDEVIFYNKDSENISQKTLSKNIKLNNLQNTLLSLIPSAV